MFDKTDVKGPSAHPLYQYLCAQRKGLFNEDIKWNFTKFLVDSKGNVVDRFAPATAPFKLEQRIIDLIREI
jgi:glutathione peroxidase